VREIENIPPHRRNSIESFAALSDIVERAYYRAKEAHAEQKRLTGESYFEGHLVPVANDLLADGVSDEKILAAALLHDTVEDTDLTLEDIKREFGDKVASYVNVVSALKSEQEAGKNEGAQEVKEKLDKLAVIKIAAVLVDEPEGVIIKIYERKRNTETLGIFPKKKRIAKANETLNVYAPMANALGLWIKKRELEDDSFKHKDLSAYRKSRGERDNDPRVQPEFRAKYSQLLKNILSENSIEGSVNPVVKSIFELYKKREQAILKAKARQVGFADINDIVSIRVLVKNTSDCYRVLEKVCALFSQENGGADGLFNPREIDNYLDLPQTNGYSALHLTINTNYGPIEIAITTNDKEEVNNLGVLAHINRKKYEKIKDYSLYVVFDDHGDTAFLPKGAKIIDVVYALFPDSAASIDAVNVNGKTLSLTDKAPNAATFSPVYSIKPRRAPDSSLIEIALPITKDRINADLLLQEKDKLKEKGNEVMEKLLTKRGLFHFDDMPGDISIRLLHEMRVADIDELILLIGLSEDVRKETSDALDKLGVDKEHFAATSIRLSGEDQEGIMAKVGELILEHGGSIFADLLEVNQKDLTFCWRLSFTGIAQREGKERELLEALQKSRLFTNIEMV